MDFLDWRILIGVGIFAAGWLLGRVDMDQVVAGARSMPAKVSEGISRLLRNERAAAALAFSEAAEPLSRANLELHFIAGELFRDIGDHESAIRTYKRLLDTPEPSTSERARARYELGIVYRKAGFLDLAQECFNQLSGTEYADMSLRNLFNLHLRNRNWREAIETEERFEHKDNTNELRRHMVAQLYCEWAEQEEQKRKAELLAEALRRNPSCGRAWLMQAQTALAEKDAKGALAALANLERHPELLPLAADMLLQAHAAAGDINKGVAFLRDAFARRPTLLAFSTFYAALAKHCGHDKLGDFCQLGLRELRGVVPVARWLDTARRTADEKERDNYENLYEALGSQHAKYRCRECDFQSRSHHWQCPACRAWETMLDGDPVSIWA